MRGRRARRGVRFRGGMRLPEGAGGGRSGRSSSTSPRGRGYGPPPGGVADCRSRCLVAVMVVSLTVVTGGVSCRPSQGWGRLFGAPPGGERFGQGAEGEVLQQPPQ